MFSTVSIRNMLDIYNRFENVISYPAFRLFPSLKNRLEGCNYSFQEMDDIFQGFPPPPEIFKLSVFKPFCPTNVRSIIFIRSEHGSNEDRGYRFLQNLASDFGFQHLLSQNVAQI